MEEKMLNDDDIIDLTDLLEEGQPPDKQGSKAEGEEPFSRLNEPDSFDLGKEISMEYDVSVEEIEPGLDIDASLSSNEERALSGEGAVEEEVITLEDTGESLESAISEAEDKSLEGIDLSLDEQQVLTEEARPETYSLEEHVIREQEDVHIPESVPGVEEDPFAKAQGIELADNTFDTGDTLEKLPPEIIEDESAVHESPVETVPEETPEYRVQSQEIVEDLRKEIPNMLEAILKPMLAELVKEVITVTRDQLPVIVEKVIREEIDKLKKLGS